MTYDRSFEAVVVRQARVLRARVRRGRLLLPVWSHRRAPRQAGGVAVLRAAAGAAMLRVRPPSGHLESNGGSRPPERRHDDVYWSERANHLPQMKLALLTVTIQLPKRTADKIMAKPKAFMSRMRRQGTPVFSLARGSQAIGRANLNALRCTLASIQHDAGQLLHDIQYGHPSKE